MNMWWLIMKILNLDGIFSTLEKTLMESYRLPQEALLVSGVWGRKDFSIGFRLKRLRI